MKTQFKACYLIQLFTTTQKNFIAVFEIDTKLNFLLKALFIHLGNHHKSYFHQN